MNNLGQSPQTSLTALTFNHAYQLKDYKRHDGNSFPIALLKTTLHWAHLQLLVLADRERENKVVLLTQMLSHIYAAAKSLQTCIYTIQYYYNTTFL